MRDKRSVCSLVATAQELHSRCLMVQKIVPLGKLIKQQELIPAYKVNIVGQGRIFNC